MNEENIIQWLLKGDVSIQYQGYRDILNTDKKELQKRISCEGWGKEFLSKRNANGHWGQRFYQPKWTSTHYTLLDLCNLNLDRDNSIAADALKLVLSSGKAADGGIPLGISTKIHSDVCVNGMFLNYAAYFKTKEQFLQSVVDSILNEVMPDGGFNCRTTRSGARHSSLHITLSVLEGLNEYKKTGYTYRIKDVLHAMESAGEFILQHRLFLSDHTGITINSDFLKFVYPCRWKYDILRAMDYFQYAGIKWDERMTEAVNIIVKKRNKDGTWNMQVAHNGKVHFVMERPGSPSRWNTLRALRVLKYYQIFPGISAYSL